MKIAIVTVAVPFIYGGAEFLAEGLKEKLIVAGHDVELVRIPFQWNPGELILDQILSARLMRLEGADRVIAMKFPAYYIQHPNKIVWLVHQFRQTYDLWGTEFQGIANTAAGTTLRRAIVQADNAYLPEARRLYAINPVVAKRLETFNHLSAQVLYTPPLLDIDQFYEGEQGDYFFCPSRINHSKRQWLMIEAMRFCKSDAKLVIAGAADHPSDLEECQTLVHRYHLEDRVDLRPTFISHAEKVKLYADSLGSVYVPFDEDSYGFVTLESYHSRKPVITTSDAGGVLAVVENGRSGIVVPPVPERLAAAMDHLFFDRNEARRLGIAGLESMRRLGISWENVIKRMTE